MASGEGVEGVPVDVDVAIAELGQTHIITLRTISSGTILIVDSNFYSIYV